MNLAVIDPGVFVAGVFWRHEPHLCLKAWLRGMMTPVMTEDMLAEYEAVLEQVKQEQQFHDGYRTVGGCLVHVGLVG